MRFFNKNEETLLILLHKQESSDAKNIEYSATSLTVQFSSIRSKLWYDILEITLFEKESIMYGEVRQVKASFTSLFEIVSGGKIVATASSKNSLFPSRKMEYSSNGDIKYHFEYKLSKDIFNIFKSHKRQNYMFEIQNSHRKFLGGLRHMVEKTNAYKRYYDEFFLDNIVYKMYEIGMGKQGMKYPIYIEDNQVALIEKDPVTKDNLDRYKVYAIDDSTLEIGCILSLYIDCMFYSDSGGSSTSRQYQKTFNKAQIKMYDPNFVKRVTE